MINGKASTAPQRPRDPKTQRPKDVHARAPVPTDRLSAAMRLSGIEGDVDTLRQGEVPYVRVYVRNPTV